MEKHLQCPERAAPRALAEFVTFLTALPGLDEVCDQLVFSWPGPDVIDRASIGQVVPEGSLVMSGCLASRAEAGAHSDRVSIGDEVPVAVAVRERETLVLEDRGAIERRFPRFADDAPEVAATIVMPLPSYSTPPGVCAVSSEEPLRHPQASAAVLSELSLALSLYLLPMVAGRVWPAAWSVQPERGARSRVRLVPDALSVRQLAVLEGMAEHLSNRQIAVRIGYSESTVRQEAMTIYAYLGVRGRREAVAAARALGLLSSEDREPQSG